MTKSRVLTFADFTGTSEADIEDMFDLDFYLRLVSDEYGVNVSAGDLQSRHPRVVVRLNEHFAANPLPHGMKFSHFRPARRLTEKIGTITIPDTTLARFEAAFTALNALLG